MSRIVLDCNVFVSALLSPEGAPAQILDRWADEDFDLVVSPLLLAELREVLSRPKFHALIDSAHVDALLSGRDCAVRDPSGNMVRIDQPPAA